MVILGEYPEGTQGVYIDIDALFDTRLAVLEYVDQELAVHNLKENWISREVDIPRHLPAEIYRNLYRARNIDILALASPTNLIMAAKNWIGQAEAASVVSPRPITTRVFLNFWPYKVTKEEAGKLADMLHGQLGDTVPVTILNVAPEDLTVALCRKYFTCMFKYDWREWLEGLAKSKELEKTMMPDVSLFVPKVYHDRLPNEEEKAREREVKLNPFKELELFTGRMVGLEFVDIEFFSSALPTNIEELKNKVDRETDQT